MDTLEDRREYLSLKFAKKCLENEKMKHIFPLNEKIHQMNMRKVEKYRVQYSNTERLGNYIYAKTTEPTMKKVNLEDQITIKCIYS